MATNRFMTRQDLASPHAPSIAVYDDLFYVWGQEMADNILTTTTLSRIHHGPNFQ
jgi:hypothetical protein